MPVILIMMIREFATQQKNQFCFIRIVRTYSVKMLMKNNEKKKLQPIIRHVGITPSHWPFAAQVMAPPCDKWYPWSHVNLATSW